MLTERGLYLYLLCACAAFDQKASTVNNKYFFQICVWISQFQIAQHELLEKTLVNVRINKSCWRCTSNSSCIPCIFVTNFSTYGFLVSGCLMGFYAEWFLFGWHASVGSTWYDYHIVMKKDKIYDAVFLFWKEKIQKFLISDFFSLLFFNFF